MAPRNPRSRDLPSQSDGYAYTPLGGDLIRVLRLPPPSLQAVKPLHCKLEVVDLFECEYEALSYCWGDARKQTITTIKIDGDEFPVSDHLEQALVTLCASNGSRTLWVDAICINQRDNAEKAMQVVRMREIYSKAQQTLVWVGEAPEHAEEAFANIQKLHVANSDESKHNIWSQGRPWVECLNQIINRTYWSRSWTVQEVVVSPDSTLHCGAFSVPFFILAHVLLHPDTKKHVNVTYSLFTYLNIVNDMRSPGYQDPSLGLFALTWRFRLRQLSEMRDRVYAFRGLLKAESLTGESAVVDYVRDTQYIWCMLSKETMLQHQTVIPIALTEKTATGWLEESTWFVDFTANDDEPNSSKESHALFWSGGLDDPSYHPLQANDFRAAGNSRAHVVADPKRSSIISVQGFACDEITAVGKAVGEFKILFGRPNYVKLFSGWETTVGGPWDQSRPDRYNDGLSTAQVFSLTVTGGGWTQQPFDWRYWNTRNYSEQLFSPAFFRAGMAGQLELGRNYNKPKEPETGYDEDRRHTYAVRTGNVQYERLRDDACEGRRIALFKSGRFGLVSEYAKAGDILVVLLGCGVPMVLHPTSNVTGLKKLFSSGRKTDDGKKTFRLRGQAYIHDLMYYRGDIQSDIDSGRVALEMFAIEGYTFGNSDAFEKSSDS